MTLSIGQLSKRTKVKVETIRYYEKSGVMPEPPRTEAGYRQYGLEHVDRLGFIRRCRELGFAMCEIQELLGLVDDKDYSCAEIQALTLAHAESVRSKIQDLQRMEDTLRRIASECSGADLPDCPIIDALMGSTGTSG